MWGIVWGVLAIAGLLFGLSGLLSVEYPGPEEPWLDEWDVPAEEDFS